MPYMPIVAGRTQSLKVVIEFSKTLVFIGKIGFRLAFEDFEFSLIESSKGFGLINPLEHSEHWFHWHDFESTDFQLFSVCISIVDHDAVNELKQMFNSLVEPYIFSSLHQQHVDLFI
jgi:hypothetical protein